MNRGLLRIDGESNKYNTIKFSNGKGDKLQRSRNEL